MKELFLTKEGWIGQSFYPTGKSTQIATSVEQAAEMLTSPDDLNPIVTSELSPYDVSAYFTSGSTTPSKAT